jgi:hypothetical protein
VLDLTFLGWWPFGPLVASFKRPKTSWCGVQSCTSFDRVQCPYLGGTLLKRFPLWNCFGHTQDCILMNWLLFMFCKLCPWSKYLHIQNTQKISCRPFSFSFVISRSWDIIIRFFIMHLCQDSDQIRKDRDDCRHWCSMLTVFLCFQSWKYCNYIITQCHSEQKIQYSLSSTVG